jgi:hypothetical protein
MFDLWGNEIQEQTQEETKKKALSYFDCVNVIQYKSDITPELINVYNPFMMNKHFMQNNRTVLLANNLNINNSIPKKAQFNYYHLMIPKNIGRSVWSKKESNKTFDLLISLGYDSTQAKEICYVYTDKQIKHELKNTKRNK